LISGGVLLKGNSAGRSLIDGRRFLNSSFSGIGARVGFSVISFSVFAKGFKGFNFLGSKSDGCF
jgi:hypothetical protein